MSMGRDLQRAALDRQMSSDKIQALSLLGLDISQYLSSPQEITDTGEPGYFQLPIGAGKSGEIPKDPEIVLNGIFEEERRIRESQVDMSRKIASQLFEQHVQALLNYVENRLRIQKEQVETLNRVSLRLEQQLEKAETEIESLKNNLAAEVAKRNKYNRFEAMEIE